MTHGYLYTERNNMKNYRLDQAYELVKSVGLINGKSDFSQNWLGQNESYLRTLKCKNAEPSIGTLAICASRLQRAAEQLLATKKYHQLGASFMYASEKLHELVNEDGIELDLAD